VIRFKAAMVPVNLLIAIQKAGFQYDMSTREVAERVVNGFVDENGDQLIWRNDTDAPDKNSVAGHMVVWERLETFNPETEE
jgi:non-homologous end joining protein Ku